MAIKSNDGDFLLDGLEEDIAAALSKKFDEGMAKAAKEAQKQKMKIKKIESIIEQVDVTNADEAATEVVSQLKDAIEDKSKKKQIKVKPKIEAEPNIDVSKTAKKQVEQASDEIQQILQQAMSKHKSKWKGIDLLDELGSDLNIDALEKKLEKLYNKTDFGSSKTYKQFVPLYSAHQALGGRKIDDYEAEIKYLTNSVGAFDELSTKEKNDIDFFKTLFDTVQKLVPVLKAANSEVREMKQNSSTTPTQPKGNKNPVLSGDTDKPQQEQRDLQTELTVTKEKLRELISSWVELNEQRKSLQFTDNMSFAQEIDKISLETDDLVSGLKEAVDFYKQLNKSYKSGESMQYQGALGSMWGVANIEDIQHQRKVIAAYMQRMNDEGISYDGLLGKTVEKEVTGTFNKYVKGLQEWEQESKKVDAANTEIDASLSKVKDTVFELLSVFGQIDVLGLSQFGGLTNSLSMQLNGDDIDSLVEKLLKYSGILKQLPEGNQTPLSSPTSSKAGEEAKETAQEIEQADEQIEASNEEVEKSEEELAQETKESREKASSSAKEHADEVEKAKDRIVKANKEVAQSEQNPLNTSSSTVGLDKESEAFKEVADSAKKAAQAKSEFSDENKNVKASADASIPSIEGEADAFTVVPMTDEWNKAVKSAEEYMSILGEVYNITRKIRTDKDGNRLISYQLTGETGNSITVGENGALISSTEKISNALDKAKESSKKAAKQTEEATKQNEDATNAYDKLYKEANKYYALLSKQKAGIKLVKDEEKELERLTREFYEASEGIGKYAKALDDLGSVESKNRYDNVRANFLQDSAQSYLDTLKVDIDKSADKFVQGTANKRALEYVEKYKNTVKELEESIKSLRTKQEQGIDIVNSKELGEVATLLVNVEQLEKQLRTMKNNKEYIELDQVKAYDQIAKISQILEKNTKMPKELQNLFEALRQKYQLAIDTGKSQKELEAINVEFAELNARLQVSGKTGKSFFDLIGTKAHHLAAQFFAMYFSFQDLLRILRSGFETIKEYDKALTEMNKVSDESISTLKEFQKESFELADAIGATASAVQNSTADWLRLGESLQEAAKSAEATNILFNVSEFESIDKATDSLVSMSQAYKDLEKMDIVDIMNNIGNNYAISTDGLASALQRSASALTTAGNDINEAVALITAGNAVVQDAESVGSGMQTIALRLVGTKEAKDQLEELGEETDGVITTVSKLRDTILSATKAASEDGKGFDILDSNGNYKSTYEIMYGLSDLYNDIVKKDKEFGTNNLNLLLETLAGE